MCAGEQTPRCRQDMVKDFHYPEGFAMLYYAVVFFVIALIAGVLGFGGIAAGAVGIAKILFFVFIVLAIVSVVFGSVKGF